MRDLTPLRGLDIIGITRSKPLSAMRDRFVYTFNAVDREACYPEYRSFGQTVTFLYEATPPQWTFIDGSTTIIAVLTALVN